LVLFSKLRNRRIAGGFFFTKFSDRRVHDNNVQANRLQDLQQIFKGDALEFLGLIPLQQLLFLPPSSRDFAGNPLYFPAFISSAK